MKQLFYLFIIAILFASCKSSSPIVTSKSKTEKESTESKKENSSKIVKKLIRTATDKVGTKYKSGGTTNDGYDCSGLMYSTFKKYDIEIPRSSTDMAKLGKKISRNRAKKGDLIFFKTNGKSFINHVGMIIEISGDEIKFVHSSTQKGVIISSTDEPYYKKTFAQINRML